MSQVLSSPVFGILLSLIAFEIGYFIYSKTKLTIFNPLFISISIVIITLLKFHISLDTYNNGGQFISFFLGPSTVILAIPLYKKINLLKKHIIPILLSITSGSCIGIISILLLSHLFNLDKTVYISLIPKSVTVPIGIEVSKELGGVPAVTAAAIILTGILGAIIGPFICKFFKIKEDIAVGVAIGTASHAVGTTKALELGETQGAMSGLSISIAGLITVFIAPIILKLFS